MKTIIKIIAYLTCFLLFISFTSCKNSEEEKPLKLKFVGYEESDLPYYLFKDSRGTKYSFSVIPNKYDLVNEDGQVNQKYKNKIFEIKWVSVEPKTKGEYDYPYNEIKTIELARIEFHEAAEWRIGTSIDKCTNCGSSDTRPYEHGGEYCNTCKVVF
jgi:hypothetical protein